MAPGPRGAGLRLRTRAVLLTVVPAAAVLGPLPTSAQSPSPACPAPRLCAQPFPARAVGPGTPSLAEAPPAEGGDRPEAAFVYSLVLPGAAQFRAGQRRWIAYLAAEAVGWGFWVERRRAGAGLRDDYRDLAWTAAREPLGVGPRQDGDFGYYETVAKWLRSGAFDADPATGLQPETDPSTYNGDLWRRARTIFFPGGPDEELPPTDPAYRAALDYYDERAFESAFEWDWTGSEEDRSRFRDLIDESDERFRHATIVAGALVANHLLSAADAFVSARLRAATGAAASTAAVRLLPAPRNGWRLHVALRP